MEVTFLLPPHSADSGGGGPPDDYKRLPYMYLYLAETANVLQLLEAMWSTCITYAEWTCSA